MIRNILPFVGFRPYKKKGSDRKGWRKPSEHDATQKIGCPVVAGANLFNVLDDEASPVVADTKSSGVDSRVKVDKDVTMFLKKTAKYAEELKLQLSPLDAEIQIKPGFIVIKSVIDSNVREPWMKRCRDIVAKFCSGFQKKSFVLDESIRDSFVDALPKLQNIVSSFEGACWLDHTKQNLIVVSPAAQHSKVVKDCQEFIQKVSLFAKQSFKIEESIRSSVERDLPTLKGFLESCNFIMERETLVVVCLRSDISNVYGKVEMFLQNIRRTNEAEYGNSHSLLNLWHDKTL